MLMAQTKTANRMGRLLTMHTYTTPRKSEIDMWAIEPATSLPPFDRIRELPGTRCAIDRMDRARSSRLRLINVGRPPINPPVKPEISPFLTHRLTYL